MATPVRAPGVFAAWGRLVHAHRWPTLAVSGVLLVVSIFALVQGGQLTNKAPEDTEAGRGFALIADELPRPTGASFLLIFAKEGLTAHDPAFREGVLEALGALRADARVRSITTPYDEDAPAQQAAAMVSRDARYAFVLVTTADEFSKARGYYPELRALVAPAEMDVVATGNLAINNEFDVTLQKDVERAEIVSLPVTLALLLLVFGTVVAALLPLGVGILAVLGGLGGVFLLARVTDVSSYAINITTLIGLGVAIDYSLFMVNRFREELARGALTGPALERTMATTGRAIFFSGLTVAIGLGGLLFFEGTFLVSMGAAGTIVVAFAVLYALTFLAALLSLLGARVNAWRLPFRKHAAASVTGRGMWHAIAVAVMRRPVAVLAVTVAVILVIGSPFLAIRLASGDVTSLPPHAESRRGYELLLAEFPGQDQTRIQVLVHDADGLALTPERIGELYDLHVALAAVPDVLRVESIIDPSRMSREEHQAFYAQPPEAWPTEVREGVRLTVGEHVALLNVLTAKTGQSDEAREIVYAIRAMDVPDAELVVTGDTAFDIDSIAFILGHLPLALAFVVVVTYVLLLLLTGSILLPLKAIVMNLLSISASFGALVWIFQQGHFSDLLGFTPASIDPTLPVIMFCIVFGLSMDYEVMMLARMQEEYQRTRDNRAAVAEGLERTGRLITGAAAIMFVVFAAFALADVVIIKAVGLGLALAVLIDATLVRALVVPAAMRLMGDLNWWGPKVLRRFSVVEH